MEALNATFVPASNESEVIPAVEVTDFPSKYLVPDINRTVLERVILMLTILIQMMDTSKRSFRNFMKSSLIKVSI
ncbi:875_t:CDS:2 [Funneliformis mosseae]|uniref:875_t:CDS:1 n=1 Tax=Funneliformis mosseae TaxID=27381 RepID=A0A9N9D917_FUNMO|nr:875_t:CDS:2 [Funneliformis mosseae]